MNPAMRGALRGWVGAQMARMLEDTNKKSADIDEKMAKLLNTEGRRTLEPQSPLTPLPAPTPPLLQPTPLASESAMAEQLGKIERSQRQLEARVNARMDEMANALLSIEALLSRQVRPIKGPANEAPNGSTGLPSSSPRAAPSRPEVEDAPIGYGGVHDA